MVRIYSGYTSKEMQWVVRSSTRVLVFTKGKVVLNSIYSLNNVQSYKFVNSKGKGDTV